MVMCAGRGVVRTCARVIAGSLALGDPVKGAAGSFDTCLMRFIRLRGSQGSAAAGRRRAVPTRASSCGGLRGTPRRWGV